MREVAQDRQVAKEEELRCIAKEIEKRLAQRWADAFPIRGIDTPKMHPKHKDRTSESIALEKQRAVAARDFLRQLILDYTRLSS